MNFWLIVPGVVLIVLSIIPFLLLRPESIEEDLDVSIRAVLLVIGFLIGVSLLFEGLTGFTGT